MTCSSIRSNLMLTRKLDKKRTTLSKTNRTAYSRQEKSANSSTLSVSQITKPFNDMSFLDSERIREKLKEEPIERVAADAKF